MAVYGNILSASSSEAHASRHHIFSVFHMFFVSRQPGTLSRIHTDIGYGSIYGNCQGSVADRGV